MSNDTDSQGLMLSVDQQSSTFINERCVLCEEDGMCCVVVNGMPIWSFHKNDLLTRDSFIAQAQILEIAKADELAGAFGLAERTVYRLRARYAETGGLGLVRKKRGPKGPRLGEARRRAIARWHDEGRAVLWMAKRLRVSPNSVRRDLRRQGLPTRYATATQLPLLPNDEGDGGTSVNRDHEIEARGSGAGSAIAGGLEHEEAPVELGANATAIAPLTVCTADRASGLATVRDGPYRGPSAPTTLAPVAPRPMIAADPSDRRMERMLAAMGLMEDAPPVFAACRDVPRAGVLLAVPALVQSGVFDIAARVYGSIGPAFYGLRTTILATTLMALLRIKHPENLKEYEPRDLGKLLGLDRAPEVKTLRRKWSRLAGNAAQTEEFVDALAHRRVALAEDALGFLYVDGHVRVYHGRADIPKTHVARLRLSVPATQDVWVNNADCDPVFFVTQPPHAQLVTALPGILRDIRRLIGDRRTTVVFDRGGWSPDLFRRMYGSGFDVLTYRKGKSENINPEEFASYTVKLPSGDVTYVLSERIVDVGNGFLMRQVTRRNDDHQTHIVTTRNDLPIVEVAVRMFDRWRQENFFKYMREQFAIDALVEYGTEPDDPDQLVPNPARRQIDHELAEAKSVLHNCEFEYATACAEGLERETVQIHGFRHIYGMSLRQPLDEARHLVATLEQKRKSIPPRVRIGDVKEEVVRLRRQRKRMSDALKVVSYQAETDLTRAISPHFARSVDEGRTLIRAALLSAADIEPTGDELIVTLAPQSTAARTAAIRALCSVLTDTCTIYPGTALRLRYAVRARPTDT